MFMPGIFGENLFDEFWNDWKPARKPAARNAAYTPAAVMKTDVLELEDGFKIDIELPGYSKEDVQAELKDGYMIISASSRSESEDKDEAGKYIRRERFYGNCSRSFYVGENMKQEDIKARFENGILSLEIPKKDPAKAVEEKKFIAIEG